MTAAVADTPTALLQVPGLHTGPVTVLSSNLNGSVWVLLHHGGVLCVPAAAVTGVEFPAPSNPCGLTVTEIEVLVEFAAAGAAGCADFEHGATPATVAVARRTLISRGLVMERRGEIRTSRTCTGHVWAITNAGRYALQPRPPATSNQQPAEGTSPHGRRHETNPPTLQDRREESPGEEGRTGQEARTSQDGAGGEEGTGQEGPGGH